MFKGIRLSELAKWTAGSLIGSGEATIASLCTDSRALRSGETFVALRGPKHDGHSHLVEVIAKGANAVVVSTPPPPDLGVPALVVADTTRALIAVGAALRKRFGGPVFAVTGSAGKSSTKDALAVLLGESVVKSPASFNNLLGVSRTLTLVEDSTRKLVLEMGMNALGEIGELCETFHPEFGLITNIGDAHVGKVGGPDGVYRAKKEMFDFLAKPGAGTKGVALNLDDAKVVEAFHAAFGKKLPPTKSYSLYPNEKADVFVCQRSVDEQSGYLSIEVSIEGRVAQWQLPLFGLHHAQNIVAAIAMARLAGVPTPEILDRVQAIRPAVHRGEVHLLTQDRILIDESYNSNPSALYSSLETLAQVDPARRRILVLGEMRELEGFAEKLHREAGERLVALHEQTRSPFIVIAVGKDMTFFLEPLRKKLPQVPWFLVESQKEALSKLLLLSKTGDVLFVKGSRGVELDPIVTHFVAQFRRP